jgi:beta-galactosidase
MHPLAGEGEQVKLSTPDGGTSSADYWTEHLHAETAEVLASYSSGRLEGTPAVTRNSFGGGTAVYLSARVDDNFLAAARRRTRGRRVARNWTRLRECRSAVVRYRW